MPSIGHALEPVVASFYELETGFSVSNPGDFTIFRDADHPYLFCTPDRLAADPERGIGVVQIKAVGGAMADREWKNGAIPLGYRIQVQHEMMVTGAAWGCLAVIFGGPTWKYQSYEIPRNEGFIQNLRRRAADFWKCVESRIPPNDPVPGKRTFQVMSRVVPGKSGTVVELPDNWEQTDQERMRLKEAVSEAERRLAEIDLSIRQTIGDAEYALLDGVPLYKLSVSNGEKSRTIYRLTAGDPKGK